LNHSGGTPVLRENFRIVIHGSDARRTRGVDRGMISVLFEIVSAAWKAHATWRNPKDGASF
jgi:hypothetical protein